MKVFERIKGPKIRVVAIDDATGKSKSTTVYGSTPQRVIQKLVDAIRESTDSSDVKVAPKAKGVASAA
jgi:hypothetical protein